MCVRPVKILQLTPAPSSPSSQPSPFLEDGFGLELQGLGSEIWEWEHYGIKRRMTQTQWVWERY